MAMWLRKSTASQEIQLGMFVDDTDFKTAETGLTIANTDIKLFKHGATSQASKNSGGATHIANGWYYAVLDATDTNTLGLLEVTVNVSGALSVRREFMILPAMIYDSLVLGTDRLDTNTTHINDVAASSVTTIAAVLGTTSAPTITSGRVNADITHIATAAVSTSTAQLGVNVVNFGGSAGTFASGRPAVNASYIGGVPVTATTSITFPSTCTVATTTGAVGSVTGNVGGNVTGSVGSIATNGIAATSIATGAITATKFAAGAIDAAALAADAGTEIGTAVWANATRTLTSLSGLTVDTVTTLTNLPTIPANWLTAAGTAADFTTEIQSGLATAASLATVAGYLDTEIAAILEDTGTTIPAQIAALNNLSAAQVNAEVDTALADYDPPTNAEMVARTLAAAAYATAAAQTTAQTSLDDIPTNAELTAALGTADDAVLSALTTLATSIDALPTNAELSTALGTADDAVLAAIATLQTYVDTEVAAIKAKTDSLTFTVAGQVDANIQYVNDVQVTGNGETGDEWGPV